MTTNVCFLWKSCKHEANLFVTGILWDIEGAGQYSLLGSCDAYELHMAGG